LRIYLEAKNAGFLVSILWGGEPTLRKDLTEIIQFAKNEANFAFIGMVTNGFFASLYIQKISAKAMGRGMGIIMILLGTISLIFYFLR